MYKFAGVETPGSSGMFNITVEYCPSAKVHVLKAATVPPSMPRIIPDYMSAPESFGSYAHSAPSGGSHFMRGVAARGSPGVEGGLADRQLSMPVAAAAAAPGVGNVAGRAAAAVASAAAAVAGGSLPGGSRFLPGGPGGILRPGGNQLGASPPVVRHTWSSRDMPARVVQRGFNPRTPPAAAAAAAAAMGVSGPTTTAAGGGGGSGVAGGSASLHRSVSVPATGTTGGNPGVILGTSAGKPPLPHAALLGGGASPTTPRSLPRYGLRGSLSSGGVGHVGLLGGSSPGRGNSPGNWGNSPLMGGGGSPNVMGRGGSPLGIVPPLSLDCEKVEGQRGEVGREGAVRKSASDVSEIEAGKGQGASSSTSGSSSPFAKATGTGTSSSTGNTSNSEAHGLQLEDGGQSPAGAVGGAAGMPLSQLCVATGIPTPSAPVAIPCGGRARGRAKSAQDLTNLQSPVGGAGGMYAASGGVAVGGAGFGVEKGGEEGVGGRGFGVGGDKVQAQLLLGEQQQVCLAPSSAPAAPRGMLGQLLGAKKRLPTAGGAAGGILGSKGGVLSGGPLSLPSTAVGGNSKAAEAAALPSSLPTSSGQSAVAGTGAAAGVTAAAGGGSIGVTQQQQQRQQQQHEQQLEQQQGLMGNTSAGGAGGAAGGRAVNPGRGGPIIVRPAPLPYATPSHFHGAHSGGMSQQGLPAALSCSPQLPFAFTPSAHSFTASAMGVPGVFGLHPGVTGGQLGLSHQGSGVGGNVGGFALALQMPSPPVSGVRDISNLATIRRPSWSSRSSSFDVAASASLPHHFSGGSGYSPMAELLEPALFASSVGLGVERGGQQHRRLEGGGEGGQGVGEVAGGVGYSAEHAQGKLALGGQISRWARWEKGVREGVRARGRGGGGAAGGARYSAEHAQGKLACGGRSLGGLEGKEKGWERKGRARGWRSGWRGEIFCKHAQGKPVSGC